MALIDSFEDNTLAGWTDAGLAGWTTDATRAVDGSVSAYLITDLNDAKDNLLFSTSGLSNYPVTGETAHVRVYIGAGADNAEILFAWGVQDASNYYYGVKRNQGRVELHSVVNGTDTELARTSGSSMLTGEFLELEVSGWDTAGNMTFTVYHADGTVDLSVSGQDPNASFVDGGVGFGVGEGGPSAAEFWVDAVTNETVTGEGSETPYLGLTLPPQGAPDWHIPINDNFAAIETEVLRLADLLNVSVIAGYTQPAEGTADWHIPVNDNFSDIESDVSTLATALSNPPSVGGYTQPAEGSVDWHIPINDNFSAIDSDLAAINNSIEPDQPPTADFTFTPTNPAVGEAVTFDGTSSTDPDGSIVTYEWDINETAYTGATVTHTFSAEGTFVATLTVTDDQGLTDSLQQQVSVESSDQPPTADFTFTPTNPAPGEEVTFDGTSSTDSDGTITTYEWDINGTAYSGETATHTFSSEGTFVATLTVTDDQGLTDSVQQQVSVGSNVTITGEQRVWHRIGTEFQGPAVSEGDATNPFTDYRLDVTFTGPSGQQYVVPGHFAADGNAAETSASSGDVWRAYLMPDEAGTWDFSVSFTTGDDVAINGGGTPTAFDGTTGSFTVQATDKVAPDFRAKGLLEHNSEHYLVHAGNGETFIKNGPGSPENFLGFYEFDQTEDLGGLSPETPSGLHEYVPHEGDWNTGDPTWQNGKGKGIIGIINYLASKSCNSQYMIIYTTDGGDGEDVWPWTGPNTKDRYDVSKLDQWEVVFEHMTTKGIQPHILFREQENDDVMDSGNLGRLNALYYREIASRFAHHPAIKWNLGEESDLSDAQLRDHAAELRNLDPYDHPIGFHTDAGDQTRYDNLYGDPNFDITSYQGPGRGIRINSWPIYARSQSQAAGDPWVVEVDEQYSAPVGVPPDGETIDGVTQEDFRKGMLWEMYLGGGSGEEWYCGFYQNQDDTDSTADDLRCEDHRERDNWWTWGSYALSFTRSLPVRDMAPDNSLVSGGFALANPGTIYAIYTTDGLIDIDLPSGTWTVEWFDPVNGGFVATESVSGGAGTALSAPSGLDDAAARITPA